jgi:hypothetical protein
MSGEIGPVEPGHEGQDLLRWPATPIDHDEVLVDRFRKYALQRCLHAAALELIPVA